MAWFLATGLSLSLREVTVTGDWYADATSPTAMLPNDSFSFPILDGVDTAATIRNALQQRGQAIDAAVARYLAVQSYVTTLTGSRHQFGKVVAT